MKVSIDVAVEGILYEPVLRNGILSYRENVPPPTSLHPINSPFIIPSNPVQIVATKPTFECAKGHLAFYHTGLTSCSSCQGEFCCWCSKGFSTEGICPWCATTQILNEEEIVDESFHLLECFSEEVNQLLSIFGQNDNPYALKVQNIKVAIVSYNFFVT